MTAPRDLSVTIVDGYVDEPAHFGVPPYVATYPRYTAGALRDAGVPAESITYHTIDGLREDNTGWRDVEAADLLIYLGGMTVPGSYVGGTPAEPDEARKLAWTATGTAIAGGPVRFGVGEQNEGGTETTRTDLDFDFLAMADVEAAVYDLVKSGLEGFSDRYRDLGEADRWAELGAFVVDQHPDHPAGLIAEIETARGCAFRCSFCTEPMYGDPSFRDPEAIHAEVAALADQGVRHFRLGRQADILAYGGDGERPNPDALEALYAGIRAAAPDLETLHMDNMNPVTIVNYPEAARAALAVIATYNTPGDTAAFGVESADPVVQEANDLLVTPDEAFEAVKLVNEVGGWRPGEDESVAPSIDPDVPTRLPTLLPGINFVHGLAGEREATFEHNRAFLDRLLESGLMVRRINIRQVMAFEGTEMESTGADLADAHKKQFKEYRAAVRKEVDVPMLERVAPPGTVLPDVRTEYQEGEYTFGRQAGTYPLLVGIPGEHPLGEFLDVAVVDHGPRSVTAVPYPLSIDEAGMDTLTAIPGIGSATAGDIFVGRPYESLEAVPGWEKLEPYVGATRSPPR
ncbi:radical SAM protein [Halodesulfurarchaeum formicicum]|uniref:Radical SAM protein n=1 Tax=Halodesulfurarchaeum formicicum TaxID=1873524 RepID=A0A1J1AEF9_9EURY|nr:radical SAM protein [Halodesulfurarchaeum formicicum]APE95969.1 radical SAM protein [Halodesulfurarchaeum formicicum]